MSQGCSSAFGPLRSFLVHGFARAMDDGCPPLLVSPGPGFARPSSFTSLRQAPIVHGLAPGWRASANSERCIGSGRRGVLRSEVKEEARSETGPGDTSAAERPVVLDLAPTFACGRAGSRERPQRAASSPEAQAGGNLK